MIGCTRCTTVLFYGKIMSSQVNQGMGSKLIGVNNEKI